MELLGSSHLGEPKQYCRTGAQEDPWISAGDHPDLIVYPEFIKLDASQVNASQATARLAAPRMALHVA